MPMDHSDRPAEGGVREAAGIGVVFCRDCQGIHVNLKDETGAIFATAFMDMAQCSDLADQLPTMVMKLRAEIGALPPTSETVQ